MLWAFGVVSNQISVNAAQDLALKYFSHRVQASDNVICWVTGINRSMFKIAKKMVWYPTV